MANDNEVIGEDERNGGIQVIARAASVLNALGESSGGMSLAEIALAVKLPRSTVQRIVQALGQAEIVHADRADGVRLGPALLRLVAHVHTDVIAIVNPHLERLCQDTGETIALGRISGPKLAFVHAVISDNILRVVPHVGTNLYMHSTSGGRALLAQLDDADALAIVGERYERITEKTVSSSAALLRALKEIRKTGIAIECDETQLGVSSVAIAIDSILGRYSISVVVPTVRFETNRKALIERVLRTKTDLLAEIGHR